MVLFANVSRFVRYADTPTERPDKLGFKMFVNIQLYPNRSLDRSNVLFSKVKLFGYLAHFCQRLAPRLAST